MSEKAKRKEKGEGFKNKIFWINIEKFYESYT